MIGEREEKPLPTLEDLEELANAPIDPNAPGARWAQLTKETLSTPEGRQNFLAGMTHAAKHPEDIQISLENQENPPSE